MSVSILASAEFFIRWQSTDARHTDHEYFAAVDFWHDSFPDDLGERLQAAGPGVPLETITPAGRLIPGVSASACHDLPRRGIDKAFAARHLPGPFRGRFYPRGWLADGATALGGIFKGDMQPFRVAGLSDECVQIDLNHPLAAYPLMVGGDICEILADHEQHGGRCNDIVADIACQGSGMQCRPAEGDVDFIHPGAFAREDPSTDTDFYRTPRLVQHIDARAREIINRLYRRSIAPDVRVLDLMSSWVSHLDGIADSITVSGLGMNSAELAENPRLADYVVRDLNREPRLPYADGIFDVVVCSVSVEYLVSPFEVFTEVARVLKPGGRCIVTFSDRWFLPKVIRLWTELHPFERMGLVLEYFRRSGLFAGLATESWCGWPRPQDDKYYPQRRTADPVFAVSGQRR
ncbi:MAG: class I SAM-dependent methyltransferase [Gammaproteobacteria bacterium]